MSISDGTRLGAFEITGQLGVGGMGEVYRATDTKLGREVAIKTLPAALAEDPDRLARFEREAKLLAALNHAHIASVYSLDEHDGTVYIAMELVHGVTLEEKLKVGTLSVEDSLQLALQTAEALEAAHDKGVIHRDLKPANIMVTADDVVKVLDFGLALAVATAPEDASPAHSPALSPAMTQQGLILGTAAYMSPEQARGLAIDKRTDIWAFGAVLYEMLTGLAAFGGSDVGEILASVIKSDMNLERLPSGVNERLRFVLARCLEKDRSKRFRDIGDVHIEIEQAIEEGNSARSSVSHGSSMSRRSMIGFSGGAAAAVIGSFVLGRAMSPRDAGRPSWLRESLPAELLRRDLARRRLAISPDGRTFVIVANGELYRRDLARGTDLRLVPDTLDCQDPFFSPRGDWVGFISTTDVWKVSLRGGGSVPIIQGSSFGGRGGSWGADGTIVLGASQAGLLRVHESGGERTEITRLEPGEVAHCWPEILPEGDAVLFTAWTGDLETCQIFAADIETGARRPLRLGGSDARFVRSTGHIVYLREGSLWAAPFDPRQGDLTGEPRRVLIEDDVSLEGQYGCGQFAVSENGTLVYMPGLLAAFETLAWFDRNGGMPDRIIDASDLAGNPTMPRLSPDGKRLALPQGPANGRNTWIHDLEGAAPPYPLTAGQGFNASIYPVWSPDGRRIVFSSQVGNSERPHLFTVLADSALPEAEPLLPGRPGVQIASDWTREDQLIFFDEVDIQNLMTFGIGDSEPQGLIVDTRFNEWFGRVSADGRLLAYDSDRSGQREIYVTTYPVPGPPIQVSANGGNEPIWSRQGHELFYREDAEGSARLVSVEIELSSLRPGPARVVVDGGFERPSYSTYDVGLDGRFLMVEPAELPPGAGQITVVLNWSDLLRERVPV